MKMTAAEAKKRVAEAKQRVLSRLLGGAHLRIVPKPIQFSKR